MTVLDIDRALSTYAVKWIGLYIGITKVIGKVIGYWLLVIGNLYKRLLVNVMVTQSKRKYK